MKSIQPATRARGGSAERPSQPRTSRAALACLTTALLAPAAAIAAPASVAVDFGQEQGPLVHTERYNNLHTTSVYQTQRPKDIAKLNSLGMHGDIYRVWLNSPNEANVLPCLEDMSSPPAAGKPCTLNPPFAKYLADASKAGKSILANLRLDGVPSFMSAGGPDAAVPLIERMLYEIKKANPKFAYLEAWNEPDAPGHPVLHHPEDIYPYYAAAVRAVNNVNARLAATMPNYLPVKVGGPTLFYFNVAWLEVFLDAYAADTDPGKKLDFIAYHGYVKRDFGITEFYKDQPSLVAGQRAKLDEMLRARGLPTSIPSYVTETGMYPFSVCDKCDTTDYARSAAGVASLHYWLTDQGKTYPFNWLMRQRSGANGGSGLKDQFVTANPIGRYQDWRAFDPLPSDFTPFGNMLLMKSKMKDVRVSAQSSNLDYKGIGVYALASHDATGASMMLWNYQSCAAGGNCSTQTYDIAVTVSNLPPSVRNRDVVERVFLIDQNTSNWFADPARAHLQEVSTRTIKTGVGYANNLALGPNALYMVLLEPVPMTVAGAAQFVPAVLNMRSIAGTELQGLITLSFKLPGSGYTLNAPTHVRLQTPLGLEPFKAVTASLTADGKTLVASFDKATMADMVPAGSSVPLTVTATLTQAGVPTAVSSTANVRVVK